MRKQHGARLVLIALCSGMALAACGSTDGARSHASTPSQHQRSHEQVRSTNASQVFVQIGATVLLSNDRAGLASVGIAHWYQGVTSTGAPVIHGDARDAIVAKFCAGLTGLVGTLRPSWFGLRLLRQRLSTKLSAVIDGSSVPTDHFGGPLAGMNQLNASLASLGRNQCAQGWVVFTVPPGMVPAVVEFSDPHAATAASGWRLQWLPGA